MESIDTTEEALVYVKDLDMFVTVQRFKDTPAVLSLGKLCEESGNSSKWKGQTPNLTQNGNIEPCKCDNFVPIVVPGRSSEAHLTNSADDPAERTKELILDEQETTLASRNWLQDLPEWVSEFTDNLVEPRSTSSGSDTRDPPEPPRPDPLPAKAPKRKYNLFTHVPKDPKCERASVRKLQEQLVDEVHKVTYSAQQSQERSPRAENTCHTRIFFSCARGSRTLGLF